MDLKKITSEYELDSSEGDIRPLANIAHVEIEPIQILGLRGVSKE